MEPAGQWGEAASGKVCALCRHVLLNVEATAQARALSGCAIMPHVDDADDWTWECVSCSYWNR
eukprot:1074238-Prorocentrum_lima.AAC.1